MREDERMRLRPSLRDRVRWVIDAKSGFVRESGGAHHRQSNPPRRCRPTRSRYHGWCTSSHRSSSLITVLAALTLIMSILHIECSVCCCCLALLPPERGAAPAPRLGFVNEPAELTKPEGFVNNIDETRGFRQRPARLTKPEPRRPAPRDPGQDLQSCPTNTHIRYNMHMRHVVRSHRCGEG